MLLRPGPAALLLSALALTTAYTPGFRLSSCVPTASLRSHRKRALLRANLPDGIEPLEGLSSLLREADIAEPEKRKEKYEDVLALMTKSMYPLGWSSLACFPY